jgi:hypothetical protein
MFDRTLALDIMYQSRNRRCLSYHCKGSFQLVVRDPVKYLQQDYAEDVQSMHDKASWRDAYAYAHAL